MPISPRIFDESRLAAVKATGLLDTDPEESFDSLSRLAATLIGAPLAFITLVDDERSFWKSRYGVEDGSYQNTVEESFCQYVIGTEEPLIVDDAASDPRTADNPSVESMGVRAWAGYPVVGPDGHVLGTFCVVDTDSRLWTGRDIEILDALSRSASREIALRHANRQAVAAYDRVRAVTETLQESLLPPNPPHVPGLQVAAWHRPAHGGEVVLGDFYDVFPTGRNRWGIVLGDVCGHGVEAAKRTALARYTVRAAATRSRAPSKILANLNRVLKDDPSADVEFISALYTAIDLSNGSVVAKVANAGHPPAVLRSADGSIELFEATGPILGVFDEVRVPPRRLQIEKGDILVMFTDGLTEARGVEGFFGIDRLTELLAGMDRPSPFGVIDAIEAALIKHTGNEFSDDIAVVAISPSNEVPEASNTRSAPDVAGATAHFVGGADLAESIIRR